MNWSRSIRPREHGAHRRVGNRDYKRGRQYSSPSRLAALQRDQPKPASTHKWRRRGCGLQRLPPLSVPRVRANSAARARGSARYRSPLADYGTRGSGHRPPVYLADHPQEPAHVGGIAHLEVARVDGLRRRVARAELVRERAVRVVQDSRRRSAVSGSGPDSCSQMCSSRIPSLTARSAPTNGFDRPRAAFARLDLRRAEIILLHGDFAPWNLLFENDCLSGIVDFEASHLNYMVADFALSWRADQDDVLAGYADVQGPESFVRTISMRRNRGYSGARPIHGPHTAAYSARQGGASDRREGAERKAVADMPRRRRGGCACWQQTHTRRHSDRFIRR